MKETGNMKWRKREERVKGNVDVGTRKKKKRECRMRGKKDNCHKDAEEI
jgi:hypothetical protein